MYIYTSERTQYLRIRQKILNINISSFVPYADERCYSLFVDLNNNIFFSVRIEHKVIVEIVDSSCSYRL